MEVLDIRCLSSCFSLNTTKSAEEVQLEINVNSESKYDEEKERATVTLHLKAGGEKEPLAIDVVYGGTFSFPQPEDENTKERYLKAIMPSVMFPFVREHVADLTRRAGLEPPLQVPIINFMKDAPPESK